MCTVDKLIALAEKCANLNGTDDAAERQAQIADQIVEFLSQEAIGVAELERLVNTPSSARWAAFYVAENPHRYTALAGQCVTVLKGIARSGGPDSLSATWKLTEFLDNL